MSLNYFYRDTIEQFTFYRVPKLLFVDEAFKSLSPTSKLLYGLMLDRSCLSRKNGWVDEYQRVFIIFTIEEIMTSLQCARQKAAKMLKELEKIGLIERKRQGLGKPNLIYVKNFNGQFSSFDNQLYGSMGNETAEVFKSNGNDTELKDNEYKDKNPSFIPENTDNDNSEAELKEQIGYESLLVCYRHHQGMVNEIYEIINEILKCNAPLIRIGSTEKNAEHVKTRFKMLSYAHIQYVMECLLSNTSKIKNIYQYLLTSLYNATFTIDSYYTKRLNHDFGVEI